MTAVAYLEIFKGLSSEAMLVVTALVVLLVQGT